MVGKLIKQPYEALDCSIDFGADLNLGDTITISSCTAENVITGVNSTAIVIAASPAPAVSGTKVKFRLQGGNDGDQHKITVRVENQTGEQLEADLALFVQQQ